MKKLHFFSAKDFKLSKKFIILTVFSILVLALLIFIAINFSLVRAKLISELERAGVLQFSTAEVLRDGNKLEIKFNIQAKDKTLARDFSDNLGISADWQKGLSLTLNEETLSKLDLPVKLNLNFVSNKELVFKNKEKSVNLEGLPKDQTFQLATGSGQLNLLGNDLSNFSLEIREPEEVLKEATETGRLTTSSVFLKMFPSLSKVSTINLRVVGKAVEGNIILK